MTEHVLFLYYKNVAGSSNKQQTKFTTFFFVLESADQPNIVTPCYKIHEQLKTQKRYCALLAPTHNKNMLEAAQLQRRQRIRYELRTTLTTGYSDTEKASKRCGALPFFTFLFKLLNIMHVYVSFQAV